MDRVDSMRGSFAASDEYEGVGDLAMTPHPQSSSDWDFLIEDIEFHLETMELRRACSRLRLEPRMFDLLRYLLDHRDRVVKKQELFEVVWDGTAVCDGALTQCVSVLRKALGDTGRTQRMLRTYPRVGYRFVGRVEPRDAGGRLERDATAQAS